MRNFVSVLSLVISSLFVQQASGQISVNNKIYHAGPQACGFSSTTSVLTAPAGSNIVRAALGNVVNQVTTNAAAGSINVTCNIKPPGDQLNGPTKGVTITGVNLLYGVQTTAFSTIGAASVQSVTYPASTAAGVAAAGTVSAALGGTITVTPTTLQLTTTTSGQCFNEFLSFGTPIVVSISNPNIQLTLDQVFNNTAAAAQTLQICDVIVNYNEVLN